MAMIKVLKFVNGIPKEINPEVDSLIAKSFKVGGAAGTELTKQLLDTLLGGGDAGTLHNHDTQYYTKAAVDAAISTASNGGGTALSNETAARIAADDALGVRIDGVVSGISSEASARAAADSAESAARIAGDATTLASSKAYTDSEVAGAKASIMGGISPATLDTIAEIAAALQSEQTATGSILSQLGDHETRIDAIEAAIPSFATDSELAAEVARATAAEVANATAISNEVTARTAADVLLDGRLDTIEADYSTATALQNEINRATARENSIESAYQAADSAEAAARVAAIASEATARIAGDATNATSIAAEQTRAQSVESALSTAITSEIARAQAAEIAEADARAVADALLSDSVTAVQASVTAEVARATAAESAEASARIAADSANASAISAEVARATAAEDLKLNKAGDTMSGVLNMGSNKISNLAPATVGTDAVTKSQLDSAVAAVTSGSSAGLSQEIADRQAADAVLQSQITTLATNLVWKKSVFAITADPALVAAPVGTALSSLLPFSDDDLPTQLAIGNFSAGMYILSSSGASSKLFKVVLDAGILKLAAPEYALASDHAFLVNNDLLDSPDAAEGRSLYHFSGVDLQKLGDFDWSFASGIDISTAYDAAIVSGNILAGDTVEVAIAKVEAKANVEKVRAMAAESALATSISNEEASRIAGDAANASAISNEVTARIAGDATNASAISAETTRATAAEASNAAAISAEVTRATAAETGLQSQITSNAAADASSYSTLSNAITNEAAARAAADTALETTLNSEISRATAAEAAITTSLGAYLKKDGSVAITGNLLPATTDTVGLGNGGVRFLEVNAKFVAAEKVLTDAIQAGTSGASLDFLGYVAIRMGNKQVKLVAAPTDATDAANKQYVDDASTAAVDVSTAASQSYTDAAVLVEKTRAENAESLLLSYNFSSFKAGEDLITDELVVLKWDAVNSEKRLYKASSAAADNADFNSGVWAVVGSVVFDVLAGNICQYQKAIGDYGFCIFETPITNADIGKSVYLATNGKASLTPPTGPGAGIVYLGPCAGTGSVYLSPAQLRGVNGDA